MDAGGDLPFFEAELKPHRSLGPRGFAILMAFVAVIGFAGGAAFWIAGAWPVFGFLGLDVLLIYVAFRLSYRQARLREYLRLDGDRLTVQRIGLDGRIRRWDLQPYWVRVECDTDAEGRGPLRLWSHGRALTIGGFLSPDERLDLAGRLREALHRWREPRGAGLRPIETA